MEQLRPEDTLTELCHAAEVFVPHEMNTEYRLKRTFVDVGGNGRSTSSLPTLSAHQYVHARKQAYRVSQAANRPIEHCTPVEAIGYDGLKKRFDQQQDALKKQQEVTLDMKNRVDLEEREYMLNVEERLNKFSQSQRTLRSSFINLFQELDECRIAAAAEQGKSFQVSSHTGTARDQVESAQERIRLENLKNRVLHLERAAHLKDRQKGQTKRTRDTPSEKSAQEFIDTMKKSRLRVHKARSVILKCERDVNIIKLHRTSFKK